MTLRINNLTVTIGEEGEKSFGVDNKPGNHLTIQVVATHDGTEISYIQFSYQAGELNVAYRFDSDMDVGAIAFHMNNQGQTESTLLDKLMAYCRSVPPDDLIRITGQREGLVPDLLEQRAVDLFTIQLGGYFAALYLLQREEVWLEVPFRISIPYAAVDVNVLGQSMFKYFLHPCAAYLSLMGGGMTKQLFGCILEFINVWGHLFDDPVPVDSSRVIMEILSGYMYLINGAVYEMDKIKGELADTFSLRVASADRYAALEERVTKLEQSETISYRLTQLEQSIAELRQMILGPPK